MSKSSIPYLINELHQLFGDDLTSPEQQRLLQALQSHIHNYNEAEPVDPNFSETLSLLLDTVESEHPIMANAIKRVIETMGNIGV